MGYHFKIGISEPDEKYLIRMKKTDKSIKKEIV